MRRPATSRCVATPSDIDELRQATAPMIAELERDPFTKKAIERIRATRSRHEAGRSRRLAGPVPVSVAIDAVGDQSVIDGTWRFEVTAQNLIDAGCRLADAAKDVGVHTFVFDNGTLSGRHANHRLLRDVQDQRQPVLLGFRSEFVRRELQRNFRP